MPTIRSGRIKSYFWRQIHFDRHKFDSWGQKFILIARNYISGGNNSSRSQTIRFLASKILSIAENSLFAERDRFGRNKFDFRWQKFVLITKNLNCCRQKLVLIAKNSTLHGNMIFIAEDFLMFAVNCVLTTKNLIFGDQILFRSPKFRFLAAKKSFDHQNGLWAP